MSCFLVLCSITDQCEDRYFVQIFRIFRLIIFFQMTQERVAKSYTFEKMHFPDKAYYEQFTEYSRNIHGPPNVRQLRTFHGIFTDLRTNGNYGLFTELSLTYRQTAITEISQNIHGFTNVTELFENNHGNWS